MTIDVEAKRYYPCARMTGQTFRCSYEGNNK